MLNDKRETSLSRTKLIFEEWDGFRWVKKGESYARHWRIIALDNNGNLTIIKEDIK